MAQRNTIRSLLLLFMEVVDNKRNVDYNQTEHNRRGKTSEGGWSNSPLTKSTMFSMQGSGACLRDWEVSDQVVQMILSCNLHLQKKIFIYIFR